MEQRVKAYIKKNSMLNPGDTVLMGVSGGGDSMAMLHMMCALQEELQIHPVVVHVQHGIRGEEAERDRILVEETCKKWGICCSVYNYQVPNLAQEWKLGIEETGRIVRKEAFAKEIEKLGVSDISVKIALAHNKNDVAETMLHNLTRGSGLRGASGIQAVSGNIIRPFLCLERKEIDHYLLEKEIPYVTDSTNLEDHYTRNRIRHHVLPVLEQEINEQAVSHMASAAEKMAVADAFLRKMGHELAEKFRITDKKYCMTAGFWEKEEILKEYAVLEMLETVAGKRKDITKLHVEQVLNSRTLQTGKYLCLPYNIVVKRDYQGITIEEIGKKTAEIPEDYENIWKIESKEGAFCPQKDFTIKIFPYEGQEICEKKYTKWFDCDKISGDLSVRNRKSGDYIVIDKTGKKKKLTRYMIDEKIPKECRESTLLLAKDSEIIWVIGGRISENYKVTQESRNILEVSYQGEHENGRKN